MEDELEQVQETTETVVDKKKPADALGDAGKAAIVKERQAREAAEKKLKAFGNLTPEEVTNLLKMKTDLETKQRQDEEAKLAEKGQYEALLLKQKTEHEKKLNAANEQLNHKDGLVKTLEQQLAESKIQYKTLGIQHETQAAFFGAKGRRGESEGTNFWFDVLWQKVGAQIKPGEDGPEIQNADGSLMLDEEKKPYTIASFVAAQKAKLPALFEREVEAAGGGKQPGSTGRKLQEKETQLVIKKSQLTDMRAFAVDKGMKVEDVFNGVDNGTIKVIDG
ncbi:MAG: hypothetical protein RBJ76_13780 [Stenomitos frigidus ULC029]